MYTEEGTKYARKINKVWSESISEDFVISTARIGEKDKPVAMIAPFPTDYQLEQIGKLVLVGNVLSVVAW